MILAEIADKMLPTSFYFGAAFLFGICAAVSLTFLRSNSRCIGLGIVVLVAGFSAWALQIDTDLIEAARNEIGQTYLTISRYWIVGSGTIAIATFLMLRIALRSNDSARKQEAEQAMGGNAVKRVR